MASRLCRWLCALLMILGLADQTCADQPQSAQLTGQVFDAQTGNPIASRVYLQDEKGTWFLVRPEPNKGQAVEYRRQRPGQPKSDEVHVTMSAHPFTISLAPGQYTLTVEHGKEYRSWSQKLDIANQPKHVEVHLKRWSDLAKQGWYSGETHSHRPLEETPALMLAEDLNVVMPLTDWVREAFVPPSERTKPEIQKLDSKPIVVDPTHVIFPRNTEYELFTVKGKSHTLGAVFALNHRSTLTKGIPPVRPLAEQIHAEGGLLEFDKHNWPWSMMIAPVMKVDLYELSNNHMWRSSFGIADFGEHEPSYLKVERDNKGWTERGWIDFTLENYYILLNCGLRMRPTAGTGSGVHPVPLGFGRVYVHLPQGFDGKSWLNGLNAGHSFITTGPMLIASLNNQDPGTTFTKAGDYALQATIRSEEPISVIEILLNGDVIKRIDAKSQADSQGGYTVSIQEKLPIQQSSWIAVRCFEPRPNQRVRYAHSGIFFVDVADKPILPKRHQIDYVIGRIETELVRNQKVLPEAALAEYREALVFYRQLRR